MNDLTLMKHLQQTAVEIIVAKAKIAYDVFNSTVLETKMLYVGTG